MPPSKYVAASCMDTMLDGDETATDCGGSCSPCADLLHCSIAKDCKSGVCTAMTCAAATCGDGVQNQGETDIDCGGPCGEMRRQAQVREQRRLHQRQLQQQGVHIVQRRREKWKRDRHGLWRRVLQVRRESRLHRLRGLPERAL